MGIIVLILKIIGIALLCIIGLLLLLILLILFVPVRYKITVGNNNDDEKLYARVRVTWLLHFINAFVSYMEGLNYRGRIIIFKIISSDKKEKDLAAYKDASAEKTEETVKETAMFDDPVSAGTGEADETDETDDEDIEKQGFIKKAKIIIEKAVEIIFNFKDKIEAAKQKVCDIKDNIDYYMDAIEDERNAEAFRLCLESLKTILKSIRIRHLTGFLHIKREDPYSYGQICSYAGIVYPFINDKIDLQVFQDEDMTSYYIYARGRITVFVILKVGIKLFFNKNIRRAIKIFKHDER